MSHFSVQRPRRRAPLATQDEVGSLAERIAITGMSGQYVDMVRSRDRLSLCVVPGTFVVFFQVDSRSDLNLCKPDWRVVQNHFESSFTACTLFADVLLFALCLCLTREGNDCRQHMQNETHDGCVQFVTRTLFAQIMHSIRLMHISFMIGGRLKTEYFITFHQDDKTHQLRSGFSLFESGQSTKLLASLRLNTGNSREL
jgi:hypothetical protein